MAEAEDGVRALERISAAEKRGESYDLILSDFRMPKMGGAELLQHLRERGSAMAERVVFVTADHVPKTNESTMRLGEAAVLLKPFDLAHLVRFVEDSADA